MVDLRVLETFRDEVNQAVVDILEEALDRAKRGELAGVAIASVKSDKMTASTVFAKTDSLPALIGAVAILQNRLLTDNE